MKEDRKPCPFCGNADTEVHVFFDGVKGRKRYSIGCENNEGDCCLIEGPEADSAEIAEMLWNSRS